MQARGLSPVSGRGYCAARFTVKVKDLSALGSVTVPAVPSNAVVASANATGQSKIYLKSAKIFPSYGPPPIGIAGSILRDETVFQLVRGDGVNENLICCQKDSQGEIALVPLDIPNMSATVRLIQPGFLRRSVQTSIVDEEFTTPLSFELIFGDANNDGTVDGADVALIQSFVGRSKADIEWDTKVPGAALVARSRPIFVSDFDENLDGQITAADVAAAQANLGRNAS